MASTDLTRELEQLFDLSLDLLCIAGLDGYFKRVNPAFERTLGYTAEEVLSRPFLDLVHPEDRDRTAAAVETLASGDPVVRFENRYICKDGTVRWLQWSTLPVLDEGILFASARDVTVRRLLTEEQAALREIAMRVAQGASSTEVFHVVAAEIEGLMGADIAGLLRYEPDGTAAVVAKYSSSGMEGMPLGTRWPLDGESVTALVWRTGRTARIDSYEDRSGTLAEAVRKSGIGAVVGAPIVADGRLWGVMATCWRRPPPGLNEIEERMPQFAELVATAIANAESRAQLTASRARLVATSDETRRRIERDLHDGTQQRLVSLALGLHAAEEKVPPELPELRADLDRIASGLAGTVEELQEISRGLHPAILSRGGLAPALRTLARRAALPVDIDVDANRRLPEQVEIAAYYVVAEAITNAAKHAHAKGLTVEVRTHDSTMTLAICDDGVGGADPARGSGLIGLRDRVEAVGGTMQVSSAPGQGTSLDVTIPIDLLDHGEN